jgi:hypothetical protein
MNVPHYLSKSLYRRDVSIVPSPVLPKTIGRALLSCCQPSQTTWVVFAKIIKGASGNRLLDRKERFRNRVLFLRGPYQQMDVVGHEYVGPDMKQVYILCTHDGTSQIFARAVRREKPLSPIAGESQLVCMSGIVIPMARFTMKIGEHSWYCGC